MKPSAPLAGLVIALCAAGAMTTSALAQTQVVRFLHNETDPPSIEFFNQAIAEFEAANPDIDVQMEAISTDGRLQKVMASINTKTMPEVFKLLPEERFEFARRGYILPLNDLVDQIGRENYIDGALIEVDGNNYDLPYTLGNFSLYYTRSDKFAELGLSPATNWDEMKANAESLTKDGDYGFIFPAGKNRMTSIFLSHMMWSAGGTYFDADLNVTFNNPGTVKALEFLRDMAAFSPEGINSYSYGDMINVYLTGRIGQDIYAPRLAANALANTPDLFGNTDVSPLPAGPSGAAVKFVNANGFALSSEAVGSKNVEAARKFLEFIATGDRLAKFSMTAFPHLIPPIKDVQQQVNAMGTPKLGGRAEFADLAFDTSNSLDFDSEAGATFADGKAIRSGVINPYIGPIVARHIPAEVVQRVVLIGEDPAAAAAWGQEQMQAIVDDLKKN
ncbi:sugar ABC transporter substrate-binding protein [Oricola sp.]|uniref:ABC transporter substrate-binding protein n=1 Tax=Oricola sp. TaxID=1979950 RepID=UPI0025DCB3E9|nr:sugar ABC transporter substrate-binding protein [Oricola sp.]MCI5076557.1 sugar ABC transporter substrate-binding protein [Oricola sp.]